MATVASSTYASSAQSVLKIFDYNLPYLEKIITVNPIIHWPHSITKILFFVFLFESEPVWGEEQHMEEQYKGSLRKGERLNKLQKDVFSYQFKCQPCLSYLLLGASIVMGIQSVFHTLTHSTHPHTHTHIHTLHRCCVFRSKYCGWHFLQFERTLRDCRWVSLELKGKWNL